MDETRRLPPHLPPPLPPQPKPAPALAGDDIAHLFAVFMGTPAPAAASRQAGSDLHAFVALLLKSDDFRSQVLRPLLLREAPAAERFAGVPPFRILDWAQRRLPLEPATRTACGAVRSWSVLLEVLLGDPLLSALDPDLAQAGIVRLLRERVAKDPTLAVKHSILGVIDSASAFEIRGWAVDLCDNATPVTLEFYADSALIGTITCDEQRPDVADTVGGSGRYGFTFRISAAHRASFAGGAHLTAIDTLLRRPIGPGVMVHADATHQLDGLAATRREIALMRETLARIERQLPDLTRLSSMPIEAYDEYWERFYRPSPDVLDEQRRLSATFAYRPLVSIVVPTYKSDPKLLDAAVRSVRAQSYPDWELILSDDATPDPSDLGVVRRLHDDEPRIRWLIGDMQAGIAANTNRALALAKGDYVAFLDHDDELAPEALYHVVLALQNKRYALIYSDEDRIEVDEFGRCVHHTPHFKPGFDHDLLLAMNYICHLVVVDRAELQRLNGLRTGFDGAQDHDLLLRLAARLKPEQVHHIARVLYHWRVTAGSVSQSEDKQEALRRTIVAVVDSHLKEIGAQAAAEPHHDELGRPRLFATRVRWRLPAKAPKVSIIIPTRDRLDLLEPCVDSILKAAPTYPGPIELVIVDNDSAEAGTQQYLRRLAGTVGARILRYRGAFNWSAINNAAAREASGDILVFLNNDTMVLAPDWCNELVANAIRPEVGAVGARLLYADGTIQHAGVVLGVEGVAGHEGIGESPAAGGYFGRTHLARRAGAVTGACLAIRRGLFLEVGGFDELQLKVAFNDVALCVRLQAAGYRVLYTPYATLYHYESKSRGRELTNAQQARHRAEGRVVQEHIGKLGDDPYYNPHFERYARPFERLRAAPL